MENLTLRQRAFFFFFFFSFQFVNEIVTGKKEKRLSLSTYFDGESREEKVIF